MVTNRRLVSLTAFSSNSPVSAWFNQLTGILKPQSNGHSNMVIGTLANRGWAVTFGTARRGLGGLRPAQTPPGCVPTSYYSMWHYKIHLHSKELSHFISIQQVDYNEASVFST